MKVYIDIETIPGGLYPSLDEIKADGRLKDADKIETDKKEKAEEIFRKRALNPMEGEIICCVYRFSDEEETTIVTGDSNSIITELYSNWVHKAGSVDKLYSITFVGFNTMFDINFLRMAALKYFPEFFKYLPHDKNSSRIKNIQDIFTMKEYGKYVSLKSVCKFLNIDHKNDIEGNQIYDYYKAGRLNEIFEYCIKDVNVLIEIERLTYES